MPSRYLLCYQRAAQFSTDAKVEHDPAAIKNLKFSAFRPEGAEPKDYTVKDEWKRRMNTTPQPFVPKPEFTKRPYDQHIRHRIDTIENDLVYRGID